MGHAFLIPFKCTVQCVHRHLDDQDIEHFEAAAQLPVGTLVCAMGCSRDLLYTVETYDKKLHFSAPES